MIPVGTNLPTRRIAWMNYLIILVTIAVWIQVEGAGVDPMRLAARSATSGWCRAR